MVSTNSEETIFTISRQDVINCAQEMGLPAEAITDEFLAQVKMGVEWGMEYWAETVKAAIKFALKS
jgi:hypothetical protein